MTEVTVTELLDISVVVPAYNEESRIEQVLRNLRRLAREVVVVDDASTDRTASVAMREGAIVIRNDAQLGYLGAISRELYELCHKGDWSAAMALQRRLWNLNEAFAKYNLAACIKGGLVLQGYPVGTPLAPQEPLPPEGVDEVKRALAAIGAL